MNTNFSDGDGDYIILKKGNNITAMGFNISKLTNKKGTVVPAGLLSQLIKENDENVDDNELKTHVVDEKEDEVVSDDLWDKLLNLASEMEKRKGKKSKMIQEQEPKKKNRRTKKKAPKKKSGKRTTRRSKSK